MIMIMMIIIIIVRHASPKSFYLKLLTFSKALSSIVHLIRLNERQRQREREREREGGRVKEGEGGN